MSNADKIVESMMAGYLTLSTPVGTDLAEYSAAARLPSVYRGAARAYSQARVRAARTGR